MTGKLRSRREALSYGGALGLGALGTMFAGAGLLSSSSVAQAALSEDGLHVQPWFLQSFLDMREDVNEAAAEGKILRIIK